MTFDTDILIFSVGATLYMVSEWESEGVREGGREGGREGMGE